MLDLAEIGRPDGQDHRPAMRGDVAQHRGVGEVARRHLEPAHRQLGQNARPRSRRGWRGRRSNASRSAPPVLENRRGRARGRAATRTGFVAAGAALLVGGLRRRARVQRVGAEGLELDGIGPGRGGHVDRAVRHPNGADRGSRQRGTIGVCGICTRGCPFLGDERGCGGVT